MTLDALDRAFDEGTIDGHALVLAPGATEWTTLAAAAGLDDDPTTPDLTPSLSPVAISKGDAPPSIAPPRDEQPSAPLDLELPDEAALRPRRRGIVLAAVASAAVVATGVGVVVTSVGESAPVDVKVNDAVQAAPPPAAEPLPPPADKSSPSTRQEVEPTRQELEPPRLTPEQKKELLEADKAREQKVRTKTKEDAPKTQKRSRPSKVAPGLLNGGDPHDPLNGKL